MAPAFDSFDHEAYMEAAFDLAREAADRGDRPFGSVLVHDEEIIMRESNRVVTEDDVRRHPELHIAHRACRELDPETRPETVMCTSTEPCPMCSGGMRYAELGRVVYSVGSDEIVEFAGGEIPVRSADILDGITEVVGPVANEAGRAIHEAFW
ncbi:MAG: tRNA(Arg) A34 adenosine deaminase TadA [Natronomonas sp.]|jgi:tRNA(Arg) A34 adenosine deaminase TadA|uniref:nucleoside deaminase n=1 Tax=Natronomonas sp. TaxID=2184060 RepID=UPI003988B7E2